MLNLIISLFIWVVYLPITIYLYRRARREIHVVKKQRLELLGLVAMWPGWLLYMTCVWLKHKVQYRRGA